MVYINSEPQGYRYYQKQMPFNKAELLILGAAMQKLIASAIGMWAEPEAAKTWTTHL